MEIPDDLTPDDVGYKDAKQIYRQNCSKLSLGFGSQNWSCQRGNWGSIKCGDTQIDIERIPTF